LRERVIGGVETLPEVAAERAIVDGAADLEQPIGAAPRAIMPLPLALSAISRWFLSYSAQGRYPSWWSTSKTAQSDRSL
jgi:hypothetical protein